MKTIAVALSRTLDRYRQALASMSTEDDALVALYRARCADPRRRMEIGERRRQWRDKQASRGELI